MSTISTETTATLARLDHALSVQDAMPVADEEWMPGDPIHDQIGRVPRPIFEVIPDWTMAAHCEPCQVRWRGADPCWMCGEERKDDWAARAWPRRSLNVGTIVRVDVQPFMEAMHRVAEAMARVDLTAIRCALEQLEDNDPHHPKPLPMNGHEYARRRKARR